MIIIHEGVPGSGKSYDAVRKIIDALQNGRTVYTNIDGLDLPECQEYISSFVGLSRDALQARLIFLTRQQVFKFWDHVQEGGFIVIDEAQLFFNSRDFAKEENRIFSDWASTHRHHGFDLLLITQRAQRIDTAVRSLAEFRYRYRKLNVFGKMFSNGYLIYTYAGEEQQHMNMRKATYEKKIFPCYNSYQGDNTEKVVQKNPNLFNHPVFWALGVVVLLCIYFFPKSNLLSGDFKAMVHGSPEKLQASTGAGAKPLMKVGKVQPPATAEAAPLLPDLAADLVMLSLDGFIQKGDKVSMMSQGVILPRVEHYDTDLMVAYVKPQFVPPKLRNLPH